MFPVIIVIAMLIIIAGIHELGHALTAKAFGLRVNKIVFGLGKPLWSFKIKGTEYGITPIPLGGYTKIGGSTKRSNDAKIIDTLKPETAEAILTGIMDGSATTTQAIEKNTGKMPETQWQYTSYS